MIGSRMCLGNMLPRFIHAASWRGRGGSRSSRSGDTAHTAAILRASGVNSTVATSVFFLKDISFSWDAIVFSPTSPHQLVARFRHCRRCC